MKKINENSIQKEDYFKITHNILYAITFLAASPLIIIYYLISQKLKTLN